MTECTFDKDAYENAQFDNVDLANGCLEDTYFYGCSFSKSLLQSALLQNCVFEKCSFERCNLSLADIAGSKFIDTTFNDSKLLGINWSNRSGIFSVNFAACMLDNNVFVDMNLNKYKFDTCTLVDASFINTKLKYALFENCDLERCQFNNVDLSFADFSTSKNYYINTTGNKLHKTVFTLPEAASLLANFDITLKE